MTVIADLWKQGYWPLQDPSFPVVGAPLEVRTARYAVRIAGRDENEKRVGHFILDHAAVGDVIGGFCWHETTRSIPGWAFAWPARAEQSAGGTVVGHDFEKTGDFKFPEVHGRPIFDATPGTSGDTFWDKDNRFEDLAPFFADSWSKIPGDFMGIILDATKEDIQTPLWMHTDPRDVAVHVKGDVRCGTLTVDLQANSHVDITRMARRQSIHRVIKDPNGSVSSPPGIAGPIGAAIAAAQGQIAQSPAGAPCVSFFGENSLAWNIAPSHQNDVRGGLVIDRPSGTRATSSITAQARSIGMASFYETGPLDTGSNGDDKHRIGSDADGHSINSLHINHEALYRKTQPLDGPMLFENAINDGVITPLKPITEGTHLTRVHLLFDVGMKHNHICGPQIGKWRWYAETFVYTPSGPPKVPEFPDVETPRNPPRVPGEGPPVTTEDGGVFEPLPGGGILGGGGGFEITQPPIPSIPVPTVGTPFTGEIGFSPPPIFTNNPLTESERPEQPTQEFPNVQTRGPILTRVDRPTSVFLPQVPVIGILKTFFPVGLSGFRSFGFEVEPKKLRVREVGEFNLNYVSTLLEFAGSVFMGRPQRINDESKTHDLRNDLNPDQEKVLEHDFTTPIIGRIEAFGAQGGIKAGPTTDEIGGTPWVYTEQPGFARYGGGTSNGGFFITSPEIGLEDTNTNFAPSDFAQSTVYFATQPDQVFFASGFPDLTEGKIVSGYRWGTNAAGDLGFDCLAVDGSPSRVLTLNSDCKVLELLERWNFRTTTVSISVRAGDFILADASGGSIILTIVLTDATNDGHQIAVQRIDSAAANTVTLRATAPDQFFGANIGIIPTGTIVFRREADTTTIASDNTNSMWRVY